MTQAEYLCWSLGKFKREVEEWQRTRKIAYTSAASMGGLQMSETEFLPLIFDNENKPEIIESQGDIEEYKKQFIQAYQ
jgi:hypothetical protein